MLKARYRKSLLGIGWSLLNPILTTLVLWVIFVQVFSAKFTIQASYGAYVLSGILFTNLIQGTIPLIGDSITATGSLASKVKSNPLVFVYASAMSGVFNFLLGLAPLIVISMTKHNFGGLKLFALIPFIILSFLLVCASGVFVAVLYSKYHDTQNIVAVLLMLLSYITPIFYPVDVLHGLVKELVIWNPLTILLNTYRNITIGYSSVSPIQIGAIVLFIFCYALSAAKILHHSWPRMVSRI